MSRLLAAHVVPLAEHKVANVLIAYGRADKPSAVALEPLFERKVVENGADYSAAVYIHTLLDIVKHRIAVENFAVRNDRKPIRVAVERKTQPAIRAFHTVPHVIGVKRTATAIDLLAAQAAVINVYGSARPPESFFRDGARRAVSAVEPHFEPAKIGVYRFYDVIDVFELAARFRSDFAAAPNIGRVVDIIFDASLLLFGKLYAVAVENLDSVVLGRIVRSRNHNAAFSAILYSKRCDCGRRQNAEKNRFAARVGNSFHEPAFEIFTAHARVSADGELARAEILAERKSRLVRERFVELFAVLASDTVRTEIFCHKSYLLTPILMF